MLYSVNLECLVIADDLTGACDAAVPFARGGRRVRVSLDSDGEPPPADVLAISTESRDAGAEVFSGALADLLRRLPELGPRILFKKIDSTLRGNVGPEVAAALAAFACDVALVTPAFPAMGRAVEGGHLRIAGDAHFVPVELAACFRHLGAGPHCHTRHGAIAQAVATGARFVLLDAASDADLDAVVSQGLALRQRVLWAGSAGLAAALARATGGQSPAGGPAPAPAGAAAIFCLGSSHPATLEQQDRLIQHRHAALFSWDTATPAAIAAALERGQPVVLRIRLGETPGERLRELLADAAGPLVLSGGTTAALVLRALDVHAIELRLEVAAGIPCGLAQGGPFHGAPVVTKSGGFGGPDALIKVADFFACPQPSRTFPPLR
jgi:uncharacterized protein YgbK (DUF1537 family)